MNNITNFKPTLAKTLFLTVALALIVSLGVAQVRAKANGVTTTFRTDTNLQVFVPCAAHGAGEFVQISGPLNIVFVTTLDGKGRYHTQYEFQPKGVSGKGLTTGTTYQGTGMTRGTFSGKIGVTEGFANFFKMSAKTGGTFQVNVRLRVNVTPAGVVIPIVDNYSIKCKGPSYPSYP